jgi:hypothetical protein
MAGTSKDPLDAALERLHALAAQIRDATAKGVNPFAHTGNMKMNTPAPTPAKVGVPSDDADKVIEARLASPLTTSLSERMRRPTK